MKRIYSVVVSLLLISAAAWLVRRGREGRPAAPGDIEQRIAILEQRQSKLPRDPDVLVDLAAAYIRKARAVGDAAWHAKAQRTVERALLLQPTHYASVRMMAWALGGQHRFEESLGWAKKARAIQPNDPFNYGTLGDACVELGDYDCAADAFQRMADLRPDASAYSRAAHLRELLGDRAGAIEIMKLAVRSGGGRDPENAAWLETQLGNMHFHGGDLDSAEAAYRRALKVWPDSHLALIAQARVSAARRRDDEAIELLRRAARYNVADAHVLLGDVYSRRGDRASAGREYSRAEQILLSQGEMARHELATFYADHDRNIARAVEWMREDLRTARDIGAYDTMAWAAFKAGLMDEARAAIEQALRLGTQDARLFYHAAMIYRASGDHSRSADYLRRARDTNPHFDIRQSVILRASL